MNVLLMLLGVAAVYYIAVKVYRKNWNKELSTVIEFATDHVVKDENAVLVEVVTNAKKLPLPYIHLKFQTDRHLLFEGMDTNSHTTDMTYRDDVFSLQSQQRITRRINMKCSRRGVYSIGDYDTVFTGLFMNELLVMKKHSGSMITVYPKAADVSDRTEITNSLFGEIERRKYLLEDKFVFRGIREYQSYDSFKDINWKASARSNGLMVNEHDESTSRNVCILLNLESDGMNVNEKIFEESISLAAGFAQLFISKGISVSVLSNGRDIDAGADGYTWLSPVSGSHQLDGINTLLARIKTENEFIPFVDLLERHFHMHGNRDVQVSEYMQDIWGSQAEPVYLLISSNRRSNLQKKYIELTKHQNSRVWIVPYISGYEWELENTEIAAYKWEVHL